MSVDAEFEREACQRLKKARVELFEKIERLALGIAPYSKLRELLKPLREAAEDDEAILAEVRAVIAEAKVEAYRETALRLLSLTKDTAP